MAQYKVPQDVEADDKLIGPFSFRQFVYLMIAGGLIAVAFVLFQIFPVLVIVPIPFIIFLGILALPLKKDQPMETYLSAVIDFYLKPQKRVWMPGQTDATITVTAPKKVEDNRTKNLSQEEASHRLSFLADIVDTEGHAIKETNLNSDFVAENSNVQDMFDSGNNYNLEHSLEQSTENRHEQLVQQMRDAINNQTIANAATVPTISHQIATPTPAPAPAPVAPLQPPVAPTSVVAQPPVINVPTPAATPTPPPLAAAPTIAPPIFEDVKASSSAVIAPDEAEIHKIYEEIRAAKKEKDDEENLASFAPPVIKDEPEEAEEEPEPQPEPEPEPIEAPELIEEPEPEPTPVAKPQEDDNQEVYISLH
ncbi:PrgI family protein [Candidatus Saccharibacteria bacterium]|nr:PrgI family protein [Candidatus Saccharibacteria bacterium]